MATYTIIGGDGKEYGPISSTDVRQWIAEGRLNQQSLAKAESDAEFRPLEKFPEFAEVFADQAPVAPAALPANFISAEDYELDLGGCISSGYELVKNNFGTLLITVLVLLAVQIAAGSFLNMTVIGGLSKVFHSAVASTLIGILAVALNALVIGPMYGGFYLLFLKMIRGQATGIGEVFSGFQRHFIQLVLGGMVVGMISAVCMAPFSYVVAEKMGPVMSQLQHLQNQQGNPDELKQVLSQMLSAYASGLPIMLVCMVPMIFLTVCWQFTLPLIADKHLSWSVAMKTSWQRVTKHWWQVFGLTLLVGLVTIAGALACGIGILFTMPIGIAAMMYGYETIFGAKKD